MDNPPVKSCLDLHPPILFGNRSFIINTLKKEVDASMPANQLLYQFCDLKIDLPILILLIYCHETIQLTHLRFKTIFKIGIFLTTR